MQRKILPDLLNAFPNLRFVISTHAPLIISSSSDFNVYALRYKDNKIFSESLDFISKAQTASQILDEVLGVSTTIPIWAEKKLQDIVTRLASNELNEVTFSRLRTELNQIGLGQYMPHALGNLLEQNDKTN